MNWKLTEAEQESLDKYVNALKTISGRDDITYYVKFVQTAIGPVVKVGSEEFRSEVDISEYDRW